MTVNYLEQAHYAATVAILRAGGLAARVVGHTAGLSIAVGLSGDSVILWSNASQSVWSYSQIDAEGNLSGHSTDLPWDSTPEDVALLIATHDYLAPVGEEG